MSKESPRQVLNRRIGETHSRITALSSGIASQTPQDATSCISDEQLAALEVAYGRRGAKALARTREMVVLTQRQERLSEIALQMTNGTARGALLDMEDFPPLVYGDVTARWKLIRARVRQIVSEKPHGPMQRRSLRLNLALVLLDGTPGVPDAIKTATSAVVSRAENTVNTLMNQGGAITMQGDVIEDLESLRLDHRKHEDAFKRGQALFLPPSSIIFQDEALADRIGKNHLLILPPAIARQYMHGDILNETIKGAEALAPRLDDCVAGYVGRQYATTKAFGYSGPLPEVIDPALIATSLLSRAAFDATVPQR